MHANDSEWGVPLLVGGGATGAGVVIGLLLPNVAESFGGEHNVDGTEHTEEEARAFEEAWSDHARSMKQTRHVAGGLVAGLGVVMTGFGVAVATGVISSETTGKRDAFSALLIGVGIWNGGAGIGSFF